MTDPAGLFMALALFLVPTGLLAWLRLHKQIEIKSSELLLAAGERTWKRTGVNRRRRGARTGDRLARGIGQGEVGDHLPDTGARQRVSPVLRTAFEADLAKSAGQDLLPLELIHP